MDSEWIADLLQHGLLKYSYIPSREQRELREATRYRKSLIQERSRALNRLQKMLEGANIKITSVLSNVMGVSSRNLIEYILDNEETMTVEQADKLVVTRIHAKIEDVVKAMDGIITPFQRALIKEVIAHIDEITERINKMDKITVVGGGLAGCEAAWQTANRGIYTEIIEMKPGKKTPAHKSDLLAELVCSNSLKAARIDSAAGLLKEEMRVLGSLTMEAAAHSAVPAGGALGYLLGGLIGASWGWRMAFMLELSTLVIYAAYITLIIQVMRLDVAWCWTSEHVYGGFLLIFCSIYLHRGKWKLKRI